MSAPSLNYDRSRVGAFLADQGGEYAETMAQFDVQDRATHHEGLELMRALVDDLAALGDVWHLDGVAGGANVSVHADYSCDAEGFSANDGHLTLAVFLGVGAGIADVGIKSLGELPHVEMRGVFDVLDGIAGLLSESMRRVAAVLTSVEPELALRVVSVEDVRSEAEDDPCLDDGDRVALREASDELIASAVVRSWSAVEDRFFDVYDQVQAAAKRAVLSAVGQG
ncbi:hypothetical protein [Rhodococcus sp. BS-15]|uniref:hypothetical protein n=1 Tax=Rhodococcus sp. BS-15 TaxID=1304954 RepID=UPI000ADAEB6E|nr:hypothetical protein [Rhodococcus sp. BS-15]